MSQQEKPRPPFQKFNSDVTEQELMQDEASRNMYEFATFPLSFLLMPFFYMSANYLHGLGINVFLIFITFPVILSFIKNLFIMKINFFKKKYFLGMVLDILVFCPMLTYVAFRLIKGNF